MGATGISAWGADVKPGFPARGGLRNGAAARAPPRFAIGAERGMLGKIGNREDGA